MKKFGKLRQWTDEKLGASQKTTATEEFKDMEAEIQTRQQGLDSVHSATTVWMRAMGKKKEGQDKEKGTPLELLGVALFQHGEDFAPDSAYGQALSRFGIAQQKVARAQEAFQQRVNDNVITNMERSLAAMKGYQGARKKLESRRLTYDSTLSKVQKAKREDFKLEEELRTAKVRYEEINDDVHQRMVAIRDAEALNLSDIAAFVDAEADYFESARDIMSQLRISFQADFGRREASRSRKASHNSISREDLFVSTPRRDASNTQLSTSSTSLTEHLDPYCLAQSASTVQTKSNNRIRTSSQQSLSFSKDSSSSEDLHTRPVAMRRLQTETASHDIPTAHLKRVKANFSFDAEADTEMSIQPGEIIIVLEQVSEGWWEGQIMDDMVDQVVRRGLFPANYCSPYVVEKAGVIPSIRPGAHRLESMSAIEDETVRSYKAQTFPRISRESTTPTVSTVATSMRNRPPPPPVPKKKHPPSISSSPQRLVSNTYARS